MIRKSIKMIAAVLLGVLLLTLPGLVACEKDDVESQEIVLGVLTDFTGPACFAVKVTHYGMMAYLKMVEEEEPIPGVKIKVLTYDTRTDYSRTVPGYIWLKGQGAMLMNVYSPHDNDVLADRFAADKIPSFGQQAVEGKTGHPWIFSLGSSSNSQGEAILMWIVDTWDYEGTGRNPKVGHIGTEMGTTWFYRDGINTFLEANPGKIDFVGHEIAPITTRVWAAEIKRLEDCDFVVNSCVGPGLASSVREARMSGYEGAFISGQEGFMGFWDVVTGAVPDEDLYSVYEVAWWPWFGEDVPFIHDLEKYIPKYYPAEAESMMRTSGPPQGWKYGMIAVDAIRRAVEKVGAENVDGAAIRDALLETDITVEGWGSAWRCTEDSHFFAGAQRMYEWIPAEEKWVVASDWYTPPLAVLD